MMYGADYWIVNIKIRKRMRVAELRMLSFMRGIYIEEKVRNNCIRGSINISSTVDKIGENIWRWLGHVLSKEETDKIRLIEKMYVHNDRGRGGSKMRWKYAIARDLRKVEVTEENTEIKVKWMFRTKVSTQNSWKRRRKGWRKIGNIDYLKIF